MQVRDEVSLRATRVLMAKAREEMESEKHASSSCTAAPQQLSVVPEMILADAPNAQTNSDTAAPKPSSGVSEVTFADTPDTHIDSDAAPSAAASAPISVQPLLLSRAGPVDVARLTAEDLELTLKSVNFYKTKASNVQRVTRAVLERGRVPSSYDALLRLPGVRACPARPHGAHVQYPT